MLGPTSLSAIKTTTFLLTERLDHCSKRNEKLQTRNIPNSNGQVYGGGVL